MGFQGTMKSRFLGKIGKMFGFGKKRPQGPSLEERKANFRSGVEEALSRGFIETEVKRRHAVKQARDWYIEQPKCSPAERRLKQTQNCGEGNGLIDGVMMTNGKPTACPFNRRNGNPPYADAA